MPIIDTILSTPATVLTLNTLEAKLDAAFTNLLHYAKTHWTYTASGNTGGAALLAGTATAAPCGGIATALKQVFMDGLGVAEVDIEYVRVTGYLWCGPNYLCFDPQVRGNVRKLETPGMYGLGCMFNEHYYLKCNDKYYDPCLSTAYKMKDESIKMKFSKVVMAGINRKMLISPDLRTCFLYMKEPVHGFQGSWAMFDTSKKNIEKALGPADFKTEMAVQHGTTEFAKFVKTL